MARLCLACQTAAQNQATHCPTCGRLLGETERAWTRGLSAWRTYLEETGWYPGRRDEWVELRLQAMQHDPTPRLTAPRRLVGRYLGGHPALTRICRVVLTRTDTAVIMVVDGWWPLRPPRVTIPLGSIRAVSAQRTVDSSLDEAVVTAAIGGARSGPLGMAIGAAIGRRRRTMRTVHVQIDLGREMAELVFRSLDDRSGAASALVRLFSGFDVRAG